MATKPQLSERLYKQVHAIPKLAQAAVTQVHSDGTLELWVESEHTDLVRHTRRQTTQTLVVQPDPATSELRQLSSYSATDNVGIIRQAWSPTRTKRAVLRNVTNRDSTKPSVQRFVEVWEGPLLTSQVDVTDLHDDFYGDTTFGSLSWARQEHQLVYVAERKCDKDLLTKFDYQPDWGERFDGKKQPMLVIVDINQQEARMVELGTDDSPGQVVFGPNDDSLLFVGYRHCGQVQGVVYCFNRPTQVYQCTLTGQDLRPLSDARWAVQTPRLTPDGRQLVYLAHPVGGPHRSCATLMAYTFADQATATIVASVADYLDQPDQFPGLYSEGLSSHTFVSTENSELWLMCTSLWGSRTTILAINLQSRHVVNMTPDSATGSWGLLDVYGTTMVASNSAPNRPPALFVASFPGAGDKANAPKAAWQLAAKYAPDSHVLPLDRLIDWEVLRFPERFPCLEAVYIAPKAVALPELQSMATAFPRAAALLDILQAWRQAVPFEKPPLIVFPHGGPHSTYVSKFAWDLATYALAGFAVLLVNYRGSLGFGQEYIDSLVGRIGEMELADVQYMADYVVAHKPVDTQRRLYQGGSHGGFIGAHLSGEYPDYYQACVLRNPVVNIGAMVFSTDIPDWCAFERGQPYDYQSYNRTSGESYQAMLECSPMRNITKVKVPTLLLIGDGDRRVPPTQGLSWFRGLRSLTKTPVQLKMYTGVGHALDSVEVETASFQHVMEFYITHGCQMTWD
ncbi:hypothetical protein H4R35_002696 [Dimargaris xerosporica]|nr:hypothetical protein H4R35_002696 [Dimargaris xerosporica]